MLVVAPLEIDLFSEPFRINSMIFEDLTIVPGVGSGLLERRCLSLLRLAFWKFGVNALFEDPDCSCVDSNRLELPIFQKS